METVLRQEVATRVKKSQDSLVTSTGLDRLTMTDQVLIRI
jgi:hypothetical protein